MPQRGADHLPAGSARTGATWRASAVRWIAPTLGWFGSVGDLAPDGYECDVVLDRSLGASVRHVVPEISPR